MTHGLQSARIAFFSVKNEVIRKQVSNFSCVFNDAQSSIWSLRLRRGAVKCQILSSVQQNGAPLSAQEMALWDTEELKEVHSSSTVRSATVCEKRSGKKKAFVTQLMDEEETYDTDLEEDSEGEILWTGTEMNLSKIAISFDKSIHL